MINRDVIFQRNASSKIKRIFVFFWQEKLMDD